MNFITGQFALFAPASALNNGQGEDTKGRVKAIRMDRFEYPYVSAQAFRYWLRGTLAAHSPEWQASPIYRGKGKQQAYTEGDPVRYWDDDLLGYMRAEKEVTLTRISPFRTSTLVAAGAVEIVEDFGVMSRDAGNPILHGHEFYRSVLVGSFSLNLNAAGCFTTVARPGYQNLSANQVETAQEMGLIYQPQDQSYRLPDEERLRRITALLRALARLEGGAKQTLHHTDVSPAFIALAFMRGGNNPFLNLIQAKPLPSLNTAVLDEALTVYQDDFLTSPLLGVRQGWLDGTQEALMERGVWAGHPRQTVETAINALWENPAWLH